MKYKLPLFALGVTLTGIAGVSAETYYFTGAQVGESFTNPIRAGRHTMRNLTPTSLRRRLSRLMK